MLIVDTLQWLEMLLILTSNVSVIIICFLAFLRGKWVKALPPHLNISMIGTDLVRIENIRHFAIILVIPVNPYSFLLQTIHKLCIAPEREG